MCVFWFGTLLPAPTLVSPMVITITSSTTNLILPHHLHSCAIAQGQTLHLLQRDTLLGNFAQWMAAIQHGFVKVSPRSLPWSSWVYRQTVEDHGKTGQATKCWFILCCGGGYA